MKRPSFLTLLTVFSLMGGLTARADKLDDWYKLLPKNTVGLIAIKNAPELLNDWEKSSSSKMMEDEEFKKWVAPMMKEGEAPWDKFFKETSGEGLYDTLKRYPGASLAIFMGDSAEDFSKDQPPLCALSDATGNQKQLEELKAKQVELALKEDDTLKQRTVDIAGVTIHVLSDDDEAEEGWKNGYAFVDEVLVQGTSLKNMAYIIQALKSGTGEGSEVVSNHLTRINQLTEGHSDIMLYVNGEKLVQWGIEAAKKAAAAGEQAIPISPDQIIAALGAEELQAVAFMFDIADTQSRLDMAVLHTEKPVGFISLMRGTSGEVDQPNFIPADVISGSVMRYSVLELWDKLLAMVNRLGPMAAMATMQLSSVENEVGVKLRDDLFASLSDEYMEVTDGTLEKQSQVLIFKVKDHDRLSGALTGVKGFVGGGFAAFEESEFLGHEISQVKTPNAQPDSAEIAYCLTKDYLLFSTGPQALLKKVLSRMKEPTGPSIWDNERTQAMIKLLPTGYTGLGVADSGKVMKVVVDAMNLAQSQVGKSSKKKAKGKKGKKAPVEDEAAALLPEDNWFDPTAVPSDDFWKRYFGTGVSGYYLPADALFYRSLTTPVEAQ